MDILSNLNKKISLIFGDPMNTNSSNATPEKDEDISWTPQELEIWSKAGLIPKDLLHPSKLTELTFFLRKNKNLLHAHYQRNREADYFEATIPPPDQWHKAPDLIVTNKKTGETTVLEMASDFQLCEGVCLRIKAKELPEWEKETADARKLDKDQHKILISTLEKIGHKPLSRKELVTLIEEARRPKRKSTKYRQSGHLIDQKLKYQPPQEQISIFDTLLPETKQKIEESRFEVKAEGIKLTYAENKLVHALNLLLCEKSQNADCKAESFYAGNVPSELIPYGMPDQKAKAAVLKFKPSELYKAFMGSDDYSGADVKYIVNTLQHLESKKVLIKYDRVKKIKEGKQTKTLTDRIEDFQSLIKIISFIPDLTNEEKNKLDNGDTTIRQARGEIIIALNPIFTDQIDTKFIECPADTNRRLTIAAGGHNKATVSMLALMEYMLRELSAKRYKAEVNEDKLPFILGLDKYVKQNKKKLLQERILKDIEAIVNLGLILQFEKIPNSSGGSKWVFSLNKDYE